MPTTSQPILPPGTKVLISKHLVEQRGSPGIAKQMRNFEGTICTIRSHYFNAGNCLRYHLVEDFNDFAWSTHFFEAEGISELETPYEYW